MQRSLQQQYPLGIVDEFQDTDPIQYAIFKKIFIDPAEPGGAVPAATLFLVGDPRQAIYGFRGGDIDTYNRAADDVFRYGGAKYTLTRNFRSAAGMIEAVNLLFSRHASPFASERITLPEISAPAKPELGNRPNPRCWSRDARTAARCGSPTSPTPTATPPCGGGRNRQCAAL